MKRRVVIISDIHLAAAPPLMMSRPDALAGFVREVAESRRDGERHELVIAGDFVDFLAVAPSRAFIADPKEACDKLRAVFEGANEPIAQALGEAVRDGLELTVLVGNHDLELCHPAVQATLAEVLAVADERAIRFVAHGEAYRAGGLLVEHGNRYDGANQNDWAGVRALVSSLSRGTASHRHEVVTHYPAVRPSAGSQLVADVIDGVRSRYPFVTLLQPEGILTMLLLRVLEPSLRADWQQLTTILNARDAQAGPAPGTIRNIDGRSEQLDPELQAAFGDDYRELMQGSQLNRAIAASDWVKLFLKTRQDSFAERIRSGQAPSPSVLRQLQLLLRKMDLGMAPFRPDGPTGEYGARAALMIRDEAVQTVVMGHTHEARSVGPPERASYINTGTWADIVCVPPGALVESDAGIDELRIFLEQLCKADPACTRFVPTFADIAIDGKMVTSARLCQYPYVAPAILAPRP